MILIPASLIKYLVAFNVVYWPVRQVAREGVSITIAFATWPAVWWVARRRRLDRFYTEQARLLLAQRAQTADDKSDADAVWQPGELDRI